MITLLSLNFSTLTLPLEDPILKFLVVLIIILFAPLLLNKIKVPHLLGLIIAGAIIGPNGFNILARDASIVVTGTTGLLYIMFLAGLEIDLNEFKKNKWKSITFGFFTFSIPFVLGILGGHFLFNFTWLTSVVFASIFSSHTLISYPIVSKLGIQKSLPVNITVGGTMITDILALLVLAICVGITQGEVTAAFWTKISVSMLIFSAVVLFGFPILGRWFFKKVSDSISQYIFVLVMIYLAALLAEIAGVEPIIGAFFAGLALNRLIPHTSTLMNRVEFVGNAIFIPFFLISVGMIINFSAFLQDFKTIEVALLMAIIGIATKYFAAVATQKTFRLTKEQGGLIFGLSASHAAATLAIVMVGYNIILGEKDTGEPIRLLDESVLNGSILLILVSCTVSSFVTQKNAQKLVKAENENTITETDPDDENILLAINHQSTVEPMASLALMIKSKNNRGKLYALNIISEEKNESSKKNAEKLLHTAQNIGAAADVEIKPLMRYDADVVNGMNNEIKEYLISDLLIGVDEKKGFSPTFVYNLYSGYLNDQNANVLVYHASQPISTIQKYIVIFPPNAHVESGFFHSLLKVWNLSRNAGSKIEFYGNEDTIKIIENIRKKSNIESSVIIFNNWTEIRKIFQKMKDNDGLILFMATREMESFLPEMQKVPEYLNEHFKNKNYLLIFPNKTRENVYKKQTRAVGNMDDFMEIGNIVGRIFK